MRNMIRLTFILFFIFPVVLYAQTSGKIAGTVVDAENNEPLPGVNVIVQGTTLGAATNAEGYFAILNVPPGSYTLKATFIGYAAYTINNVVVKIDLTTNIDFKMTPEALAAEEVVVVAERPVITPDVSSSQANLSIEDIENLPVVNVASVISLEAGVSGLSVRGGSSNETAFVLNGITLRDERDNTPFTAISYTAVSEIQLQTGGFNAEYGNIRSGLINVVTKEGELDRYSFSMLARYRAADQKHFGDPINARDSYWVRPYLDDAVAWTGTESGAWDEFTQRQYPEFEGWNAVAQRTLLDDDPSNDLTPAAAQKLYLWQHRKVLDVEIPDYDVDMSLGGPVPFVSKPLGNLRFFASYRRTQDAYLLPLSDDAYRDYLGQLKITTSFGGGKKLMIEGLLSRTTGTNTNNVGLPGIFRSPEGIASNLSGVSFIESRIFANDYWAPSTIKRNSIGAKYTHVVNSNTFFEVTLHRFQSNYDTNPGRPRDTANVYDLGGGLLVDEAPFGFIPSPSVGINGMRMSVGFSNSRDSSQVTVWTGKFDFSSQLNRFHYLKTGVELVYTDNNVNYASVDAFLPSGRSQSKWRRFPVRGAFYLQDKIEFQGMIANLGLRLDYSHAGGDWYVYDPFDRAFTARNSLGIDTLLTKESTEKIWSLSPRLGIAFPISINSKLFFNYGHFRQLPLPENLFLLRRFSDNNAVTRIANPNNPLQKTVAYELGYEHNLFDQFLVRLTGYYKDVSLQSSLVTYTSRDNAVNYSVTEPNSYEDIRGFELTLRKNRGNWVQGFLNYTLMIESRGFFGFRQFAESPATQREIERDTNPLAQIKPVARPYARANIDFFTPIGYGPKVAGLSLLGDWRMNILGTWSSGFHFTWVGGGGASNPGIVNNLQWKDYYNVNLRLSKNFKFSRANLQFFLDVSNLFDYKYMSQYGFVTGTDFDEYMRSLHLPAEALEGVIYEGKVSGKDRPGDYREVPYRRYDPNSSEAAQQEILDSKAYIDMPNQSFFTFLNPRDLFWGMRLSFDVF